MHWLPALRRIVVPPRRYPGSRVALAWDERGAVGMYGRHAEDPVRLGCGVIWATDQLARSENLFRLQILRLVLRRLDFIWVLSRAQLDPLRRWLSMELSDDSYVPFGIDTDFYPVQPWPEQPLIFSLGNDRDRDIPTLYGALAQVHAERPDVRMVVQTGSASPPPPGVTVHASLTTAKVKALYAAATLVVIATRSNLHVSGLTTCLEAMATGRPVVMSRTAGMDDYVREGAHGRLADPADPRALASVILESLADEPALVRMGDAAAAHVRERHTETTMARGISRLAEGG